MLFKNKVFLKISQIQRKTPLPEALNFIKKETLAQLFSSAFCELFEYREKKHPQIKFHILPKQKYE